MIREILDEWSRVVKLSRKPKKYELVTIAKVTGLGMLIVGLIGFMIRMIIQILGAVL